MTQPRRCLLTDARTPDEGTHFVSRLWSRSGLRMLSIFVLMFGLVGGGVLSLDRQSQQRATALGEQARIDSSYQQQLQQEKAAAYQAAAPFRAAQATAQAKAAAAAAAAAAKAKAAETAARKAHVATRSTTRTPSFGPIPTSCSTYDGNRAIGCTLLLDAGFGLSEMPCLDKMWTRESNWRTTAENPSSHSYGIPQALPADKMAKKPGGPD